MKVNVYDPENVQKGTMMLLNIAEDLKGDAKMTVSPQQQEKKIAAPGEKKPSSIDEIKRAAESNKSKRDNLQTKIDEEHDYDSDMENQPEYLHMELKSTSTFKDIDIDAMLEHTSFDEFMQGLYINRAKQNTQGDKGMTDFDRMMANVMDGREDE